jgi:hypothetical protein
MGHLSVKLEQLISAEDERKKSNNTATDIEGQTVE